MSTNKMSLLDEAKARSAAAHLANNPTAQKMASTMASDPYVQQAAYQAASDPRVQQAAMDAARGQMQQQFNPPAKQPNISPIKTSNQNPVPPQPPTSHLSDTNLYSSKPTKAPLTAKEIAKQHRENWKVNESKMNVASTEQMTSGVAPRWVPNQEKKECSRCMANFDWAQRRHHCRRCGDVFCGSCTSQKALLPLGTAAKSSDTKNPRRVCYDCFEAVKDIQDELAYKQSNSMRENTIDAKNRYLNSPIRFTMGAEIRKAAYIVRNFHSGLENKLEDSSVPLKLIRDACGLAILTVMKVGFVWTGRGGTGLVVARRGDGSWSPPSAIMMAGTGFGAQIGGEVTDIVVVLTSAAAVTAFCSKGQVSLGGGSGVSVEPLGRSVEGAVRAGDKGVSACVSYSHSKGFFAGVSIEGSIISQRPDINKKFYGTSKHTPLELLKGNVPPAPAAKPLYDALNDLLASDPTNAIRAGFLGNGGGTVGPSGGATGGMGAFGGGVGSGGGSGGGQQSNQNLVGI